VVRGNLCKLSVNQASMTILKLYLHLYGYMVCFLLCRDIDVEFSGCRIPKINIVHVVIMIIIYLYSIPT
jgi:hypothetical protein